MKKNRNAHANSGFSWLRERVFLLSNQIGTAVQKRISNKTYHGSAATKILYSLYNITVSIQ